MEESDHEEIQIRGKIKSKQISRPHFSWLPVIILLIIIFIVVVISIYLPKASAIILIGIPIASSKVNLFISKREKRNKHVD